MPSLTPTQVQTLQGNLPLLIERLCERFLETTLPIAKDRVMPYVKEGIAELESKGKLEVPDTIQLCGGIIWDAIREYWKERL
jgi:hypothetical protein